MGERVASCCRRSECHWGFFLTPVFSFPLSLGCPGRLSFFARSGAYICGGDRGECRITKANRVNVTTGIKYHSIAGLGIAVEEIYCREGENVRGGD